MKAMVSVMCCGRLVLVAMAFAWLTASGPCPLMQLCRLIPPGTNPPPAPASLASYSPWIRPMNSLITLRWNHGGRKVCSATSQRGGKITKSMLAVPGVSLGEVGTVVADRADGGEAAQIVAVGGVAAVPRHHVERRMVDRRRPQGALELRDQLEFAFDVLVRRGRRLEVARIGEAVGADRPQFRQPQRRTEVLADVAARRSIGQFNPEAQPARNQRDLLRLDFQHAEFGRDPQAA